MGIFCWSKENYYFASGYFTAGSLAVLMRASLNSFEVGGRIKSTSSPDIRYTVGCPGKFSTILKGVHGIASIHCGVLNFCIKACCILPSILTRSE